MGRPAAHNSMMTRIVTGIPYQEHEENNMNETLNGVLWIILMNWIPILTIFFIILLDIFG